MDCGFCIATYVDEGGLDDYSVKFDVASEPIECYECTHQIAAGEGCEIATGVQDDGSPFRCVTCLDCADVAKAFCCESRMHGSLWADLEASIDYGAKITTGCLNKLTRASAKAKVRDLWNEMTLEATDGR